MTLRAQRKSLSLHQSWVLPLIAIFLAVFLPRNEVYGQKLFCGPKSPKIEPEVARWIAEGRAQPHLVWVFFTDKGFTQPEQYSKMRERWETGLSPRVLSRRLKCLPPGGIVDFHDLPLCQQYVNKVRGLRLEIRHCSRWLNGVSLWATSVQVEKLAKLRFVRCIQKLKRSSGIQPLPSSRQLLPSPKSCSGCFIDYGPSFWQLEQIYVPELHQQGYDGQGVRICLLDSGFDNLGHRVFSRMRIVGAWDFLDGDEDVSGDDHGTRTLSVVGGFSPGNLVGPAFGAEFILARTEDVGSETPVEEDNWIAGLEWAEGQGADVVSSSLGYLDWDPGTGENYTWEDLDGDHAKTTIAADIAVQKGVVVVNSAGNNGPDGLLNTPADGKGVISVGAVDPSGLLAYFSSRGPTYDGRIKPDVVAGGVGVISASASDSDGYEPVQGTSFSAPLVAGVCALLLQIHPDWTPRKIAEALRQTATDLGPPGPDNLYGWGLVNAAAAARFDPSPVAPPKLTSTVYGCPNPCRGTGARIYTPLLPEREATLHIYSATGFLVRSLTGFMLEGDKEFVFWDGKNQEGRPVASGIYFCQVQCGRLKAAGKITVIK